MTCELLSFDFLCEINVSCELIYGSILISVGKFRDQGIEFRFDSTLNQEHKQGVLCVYEQRGHGKGYLNWVCIELIEHEHANKASPN